MIWFLLACHDTMSWKHSEEIHKAARMINSQYSKHRDNMESSTENKAVRKKKKKKQP